MSYGFVDIEQAMWLIGRVPPRSVSGGISGVRETIRGAIASGLDAPRDFNRLLTWANTLQGSSYWDNVHTRLDSWSNAEGLDPESCVAYVNEQLGRPPVTPTAFEIPTSGFSRWIYNTCLAQTEKMRRGQAENSLTREERELLEYWCQRDPDHAKLFVRYMRSVGNWRGNEADTRAILSRGSSDDFLPLQMVVPLRGSDSNGHNYPIDKPTLMIKSRTGIRIGSRGNGNNLCVNRPTHVRPATVEEINQFFAQTPREKYIQYLESHFLPSLRDEYPAPEIPL